MPKINVYVPDVLASAVKQAGVPVSAVCQAALADAVERVTRARGGIALLRDPATPAAALTRLAEGLRTRMTPRLSAALRAAGAIAERRNAVGVTSLDALGGLLADGENLAGRLLVTQGVDLEVLHRQATATRSAETVPAPAEHAAALLARLSMAARAACASGLEAALEMGHNYLGCEHLLIGLVEGDTDAGALLRGNGLRADALRHALSGAIAGVVHERSTSSGGGGPELGDLLRRVEALERRLAESRMP